MGGTADTWSKGVLKNAANKDIVKLCLWDIFKDDIIHAASSSEEGDHSHDHDEEHADHGADEHFWLSLRTAQKAVAAITETLCAVYAADSASCATFRRNAAAYTDMLASLDKRYRDVVAAAPRDGILVADRFPFAYLTTE